WVDKCRCLVLREGKPALGNCFLDRQVAHAAKATSKRVPADEQQMENKNPESKPFMVGGSSHVAQLKRLKLRRRKVRRTDGTIERTVSGGQLARIGVDHPER